jgi:molecular chaperone DnaK
MQIMPSSGLTDSEIDRMVDEAERNREEDERRKSHIEARNRADSLVFAAEKTLREQGEAISAELKSEIETSVEAVKKALEQDDVDEINRTAADLGQVIQKVGAQMYGSDAAGGGTTAGPGDQDAGGKSGGGSDDENVVEGEFSEAS